MPPSHITDRTSSDEDGASEFTAIVTEVREHSRVAGKPLFQIALDSTAFVPMTAVAGRVLGVLLATARSGAVLQAPITEVSRDGTGETWHTTVKPLQPGTVVVGRVGDVDRMCRSD